MRLSYSHRFPLLNANLLGTVCWCLGYSWEGTARETYTSVGRSWHRWSQKSYILSSSLIIESEGARTATCVESHARIGIPSLACTLTLKMAVARNNLLQRRPSCSDELLMPPDASPVPCVESRARTHALHAVCRKPCLHSHTEDGSGPEQSPAAPALVE